MSVTFDFSGKRFVVTGASSGLGKQITLDIVKAGGYVLALARRIELLKEIQQVSPSQISFAALDVADFKELRITLDKYGSEKKIDGSVHAAGINRLTPLKAFNWLEAEKIFKTSVFGGIELIRLLSSVRLSAPNSAHVLISSVAAIKGEIGFTAYSAAKSAILGAMRSMALELAPKGIRVNAISPGLVETPLTSDMEKSYPSGVESIISKHPLGLGKPADVAALVLFLLSEQARWISGANIIIDGGYTI